MTDITVKMDRVHLVSTTAQYFYRWLGGWDEDVCEGRREYEEERTMKEGADWNNKGPDRLEKETGNYQRSRKYPLWGKSEQTGVV